MGTLALSPFFTFAYEPETTHKALTQEIIKVFNAYYPNLKIGDVERSMVESGSVAEDNGLRALHHFYDPVYARGLAGQIPAKDWAENTLAQASIFRPLAGAITGVFGAPTDYSWDRAVYDYVWVSKSRGLDGLGHILHLIEDMSVPDHTRNDAHPPYADKMFRQASPYEHWADKWNTGNIAVAGKILATGEKPKICAVLGECFDSMAIYSNNNFFSKDTMPSKDSIYLLPTKGEARKEKLTTGDIREFILSTNRDKHRLARIEKNIITNSKLYFLEDEDNLVLSDYWSHLSKQAVLHGAGIVKLFFEAVEEERESKRLFTKNKSLTERLAGAMPSRLASIVGISPQPEPKPLVEEIPQSAFEIHLAVKPPSGSPGSLPDGKKPGFLAVSKPGFEESGVFSPPSGVTHLVVQQPSGTANLGTKSPSENDLPFFLQLHAAGGGGTPGFGGGSTALTTGGSTSSSTSDVVPEGDIEPPNAPAIISPAEDNLIFTSTAIYFSGTAEAGSVISNDFNSATITANGEMAWQFNLSNLHQGTTTIKFTAQDEAGNQSTSTARTVFVDSLGPGATLIIEECEEGGSSISEDGCLLSETGEITLNWSTDADDFDHYIAECESGGEECDGFDFSETTETNATYELPSGNTLYTFKVRAVDRHGNTGGEDSQTLEVISMPVVINEIAWAGTAASANDEWIELYNRSSKSVNLVNWVLRAEDGVPYINLSGTISAGGYYLIERTSDNTVSDTAADLIAPFSGAGSGSGLGNPFGEILILSHASTTIDQIPNCGANWSDCGGSASGAHPTMERVDPEVAGTDFTNWGTSNETVKNGLDSAGAALTATPRARNSVHYLIAQVPTLAADRVLKKSFGIYIIKNNENLTVPAGITLTIEPGVVVKIGNESRIIVNGTLKSDGTSADNIIFKSLNDPAAYWKNVLISSESVGSSVSYARFEYGGRYFSDTPSEERAALSIFGNSTSVSHSIFQNSFSAGLRLTSSDSSVSANTFSVGTTTANNVGLYTSGGSPQISQNTFSQNYTGLYITGAGNITDNVFENNIDYPVYSLGGKASFSGNSGSGNGTNGIALTNNIATAGATTTLSANSLPYIIRAASYGAVVIPAGAGVIIGTGVKLAGEDNQTEFIVNGTLKLEGASKDSIIFTSRLDTAPAGWSGILVNSTGRVYGGGFTLRYGGKGVGCPTCAGFRVEGGSVDLSDAIIQNNYLAGMRFSGAATSTLNNFEFRDHQTPTGESTGLVSSASPLTLTNLTFSNNFANTSPENLYSPD